MPLPDGKGAGAPAWRFLFPSGSLISRDALIHGGQGLQVQPPTGSCLTAVHARKGHHGVEKHKDQDAQSDFAVAEARPRGDRQQRWVGLGVLVVVVEVVVVVLLLLVKGGVMALAVERLGVRGFGGCIGIAVWVVIIARVPRHVTTLGSLSK